MFQVSSNLLYLCAATVAAAREHWAWALIMAAVTACSVLYHTGRLQRHWDVLVACFTLAYGALWYMSKGERSVYVPLFTLAMIGCLAAPKRDRREYDTIHPWAHVFGGLASITLAAR